MMVFRTLFFLKKKIKKVANKNNTEREQREIESESGRVRVEYTYKIHRYTVYVRMHSRVRGRNTIMIVLRILQI